MSRITCSFFPLSSHEQLHILKILRLSTVKILLWIYQHLFFIQLSSNFLFTNLLIPWLIYRHLSQLARKGGNPLNFDFVEHHKVTFHAMLCLSFIFAFITFSNVFICCLSRPQHLHLLLWARRVYGMWMARSSKHTSYLHKFFEASLAYSQLVLKSNRGLDLSEELSFLTNCF